MTSQFAPGTANQSPDVRFPGDHLEGSRLAARDAISRASRSVAIDSAEGLLLGPDGQRHPAESDGAGNLKTVLADDVLSALLGEMKAIRLGMEMLVNSLTDVNIDLLDAVSDEL